MRRRRRRRWRVEELMGVRRIRVAAHRVLLDAAARAGRGSYRSGRDLGQRLVDRALNVRTSDRASGTIGLSEASARRYRASGWYSTWCTLRRLRPSRDDVFLDVGSGLGRTVLLARRMRFRRVIGVELSPEMHTVAEGNLRDERLPGRAPTTLVLDDVLRYDIPSDVTVVYLYNTLNGDAFAELAERLIAAVDAHPRPLRIAYLNPVEEHQLLATGRVKRIGEVRGSLRPDGSWARTLTTYLYEVLPAAS
jgi:SAM-dependent methyltransferase